MCFFDNASDSSPPSTPPEPPLSPRWRVKDVAEMRKGQQQCKICNELFPVKVIQRFPCAGDCGRSVAACPHCAETTEIELVCLLCHRLA